MMKKTEPAIRYTIELRALMRKGCTEHEAERYTNLLCDYLMELANLPCGSDAKVVQLASQDVGNVFPNCEEED
jgi:hypothetical protein